MNNYLISEILLITGFLISLFAQLFISISYSKYKRVGIRKKISGFETARKILDDNGLQDVYVTETKGNLTDHYDPNRKVIRLSTEIFHGTTIAASSVAAHEVGHAIQDKESYSFMRFRSAIFPLVRIASYGGYFAILIGIIFGMTDLTWLGIACEIIIIFFQLLTLPVEFNASERAKKELVRLGILENDELDGGSKMLRAAAFTYVASVLTTILQILRLIVMLSGRDD